MLTNCKFLFWEPYLNFFYGNKNRKNQGNLWYSRKWTKINVQN